MLVNVAVSESYEKLLRHVVRCEYVSAVVALYKGTAHEHLLSAELYVTAEVVEREVHSLETVYGVRENRNSHARLRLTACDVRL